MAITTTCPNCKARFRLADEMAGKRVRCQKCNGIFEVPVFDGSMGSPTQAAPSSEAPAEAPASPLAAVPLPPMPIAAAAPVAEAAEEDEERRRDDDDDDGDRPPPIKKRRDAKRPARREAKSGSSTMMLVLVAGGLAVFACLICSGVGVAVIVINNDKKKDVVAKARDNPLPKDGLVKKQLPPMNDPPPPPPPAGQPNRINVNFGPTGQFRHDSQLTQNDPPNVQGNRHKLYVVNLEANRTYQIDMMSNQIDPYLVVINQANGNILQDDDGGGDLNARLVITPPQAGMYQIEATHCPPGINPVAPTTGNYTLIIQRR